MEQEIKVYTVLVGKPEGKKQPGRQRRRWKNGIRMNLGEIGWGGEGFNWLGTGAGGGLL
jgi:hypothetical protein